MPSPTVYTPVTELAHPADTPAERPADLLTRLIDHWVVLPEEWEEAVTEMTASLSRGLRLPSERRIRSNSATVAPRTSTSMTARWGTVLLAVPALTISAVLTSTTK